MVEVSIIYLSVLIVSAILGIQIADESILALNAKAFLRLQPYSKSVLALSKFSTYYKLLPRLFYVLIIPITIFIIILKLHHFISELLNCSRCTATWIYGILQYMILDVNLLYSILFAPLVIGVVYILERIRC